ncbi:MAG: hypothetical protein E7167_02950 [Firmicutes bacterium]|nr:hypothetical protein [Bacillota bacterium]
MFKDLKIFVDKKKTNYNIDINHGTITGSLFIEDNSNILNIVFDENIYDNISFIEDISFEVINKHKIEVDLKSLTNKLITFKLEVNFKFFIKSVYKFINDFIDIEALQFELNIFKSSINGNIYKKQIDTIINEIDKMTIDELILADEEEKYRIENILLNSELYSNLINKMTAKDLMLLITEYISCNKPFNINQETFDELLKAAVDYDDSLENVWRLAMNYDERGLNFDLLEYFFVKSKDCWYLCEYISGVFQANQENIINLIVATKDKSFINSLLKDYFDHSNFDKKYKTILIEELNNL